MTNNQARNRATAYLWTMRNYIKEGQKHLEQNPISTGSYDYQFNSAMASYMKGKAEAFKEISEILED
jgi:hypothetical protein